MPDNKIHMPPSFTIDALREGDLSYIIPIIRSWVKKDDRVIEEEVNSILERFKTNLSGDNGDSYLVARDNLGITIGIMGFSEVHPLMACYRSSAQSKSSGLAAAFLSPDCRGQGLGKSLLSAVFGKAKETGWTEMIWSSNPRYRHTAWNFYTGIAGEPVGTIEDFFQKGTKTPVWRKAL